MEQSKIKDFFNNYDLYKESFDQVKNDIYKRLKDYVSFAGQYADITGPYSEDFIEDVCFRKIDTYDGLAEFTFVVYKSKNEIIYAEELVIVVPIESLYVESLDDAKKIWSHQIMVNNDTSKREISQKIKSLENMIKDIDSKKEDLIKEIDNLKALSGIGN